MANSLTEISSSKVWNGFQKVYSHTSQEVGCLMKFAVFLPPQYGEKPLSVVYWLSGLECNELNFVQKAGAQQYAAKHELILVCPDTSPRGLNLPGDKESWDFGEGAGFYLDATRAPWNINYRMFSYVTSELVNVINSNFCVTKKQSIMGHSMGGHGALICFLKTTNLYESISAFAPICNPTKAPWGIKAFEGYLGSQETGQWKEWDATELLKSRKTATPGPAIFIDQGSNDKFMDQLLPNNFTEACKEANIQYDLRMRDGYDHSYFYISSFIGEHIEFHSGFLNKRNC